MGILSSSIRLSDESTSENGLKVSNNRKSRRKNLPIPKSYHVNRLLDQGGFGAVYRCLKPGTSEEVAVKIQKTLAPHMYREAKMMKFLKSHKLDEANIVKFHGELFVGLKMSLEFELLDTSLKDYISHHNQPMPLDDIRAIITQLAVAFDALKSVGIIHTDVKMSNIMFVDEINQPLKVKLIDFGVAVFKTQTKPGNIFQPTSLRAPEIVFGLPFSEAIDMWSLGCIMAFMLCCSDPFPGNNQHQILKTIIKVLGPPPKHLLDAGLRTKDFFKKEGDSWTLKASRAFWQKEPPFQMRDEDSALGDLKMWRRYLKDDPDELRECVALLKAMLQWDAKERITPEGIMNHPFITRSYVNNRLHSSQSTEEESLFPAAPPNSCSESSGSSKISPCSNSLDSLSTSTSFSSSETWGSLDSPSSFSSPETWGSLDSPSSFSSSETWGSLDSPSSFGSSETWGSLDSPSSSNFSESFEMLNSLACFNILETSETSRLPPRFSCLETTKMLESLARADCPATYESSKLPPRFSCLKTPDPLGGDFNFLGTSDIWEPPETLDFLETSDVLTPLASFNFLGNSDILEPPTCFNYLETSEIVTPPQCAGCSDASVISSCCLESGDGPDSTSRHLNPENLDLKDKDEKTTKKKKKDCFHRFFSRIRTILTSRVAA